MLESTIRTDSLEVFRAVVVRPTCLIELGATQTHRKVVDDIFYSGYVSWSFATDSMGRPNSKPASISSNGGLK